MTKDLDDLLNSEDFATFIDSVEHFCRTLERLESLPRALFLQEMDRLLPLVYSTASVLPDYPWDEDEDDGDDRQDASLEQFAKELDMQKSLVDKLGHVDSYSFVFDPVDHGNREVIYGSLAEDLASVYADVRQPLALFRVGEEAGIKQALWDWGFGRKIHWGRHAVHAIGVIYSLVHQHYVEDEGTFDVASDGPVTNA